jgi:hypothetical protein|tara:strand:+ start:292 stop:615 length:324 start_codon:yes stop_codon:yes gene_type:complete
LNTSTNNDSNEDLSKNDIDFINRLAKKIHSSGFVTPCVLFLEMVRPISSLGSHAMVFLGPIINGLVQSDGYYRAAELLNNKEIIAILLDEIERLEMLDSVDDNRSNN